MCCCSGERSLLCNSSFCEMNLYSETIAGISWQYFNCIVLYSVMVAATSRYLYFNYIVLYIVMAAATTRLEQLYL